MGAGLKWGQVMGAGLEMEAGYGGRLSGAGFLEAGFKIRVQVFSSTKPLLAKCEVSLHLQRPFLTLPTLLS